MTASDIMWFTAEMAAYAATVWWALTRRLATRLRVALALALLLVFAGTWGVFASPTASVVLTGAAAVLFKTAWFTAAAAAGLSAARRRYRRAQPPVVAA